jgi:hypothetical protein
LVESHIVFRLQPAWWALSFAAGRAEVVYCELQFFREGLRDEKHVLQQIGGSGDVLFLRNAPGLWTRYAGLNDDDLADISCGNAERLLGLSSATGDETQDRYR